MKGTRMKSRTAFAAIAVMMALGARGDRVLLDEGWTFTLEGEAARMVDVPHDWSIEFAPYAKAPTEYGGGFYRAGKATYERTFVLSSEDMKRELSLEFEGVYCDATVFVNGVEAGRGTFYGYTGFKIPLEGKVHAGENTLRVDVDNSAQPNCRWYSGSGIIKPVWLMKDVSRRDAEAQSCSTNLCGLSALREIKWSAEEGLTIDGTNVLLHGACVHHDHGPLGAAAWPEAELRKVRLLKAAGFNAVRCSHNPASEAFLDACDAEGLWVVQELCDGWREKKNRHDYGEVFEEDWEKDLRWMVERDKHHPSIIAWSIGNEILERTSPWAAEQAERMVKTVKEIDPSRPVLEALCSWHGKGEWVAQDAMAGKLDIVGYNYMEHMTEGDHERCPERVIVYTETYPRDATNTWRRITQHPYVIGEFVWTGIDYLGESTIGRTYYKGKEPSGEHYKVANKGFPWHGAYCGDIDLTGWRKPISHLRETLWNENAPTYMCVNEPDGWRGEIKTTLWSVWPQHEHWNFDGWEGKPVTVEVYTRKPHVELYLNGRKVGEADVSEETAWMAKFEVPYEPGELKAIGCDSRRDAEAQSCSTNLCGLSALREIKCDTVLLRTAGEPKEVRYAVERIGRLEFVTVEVVDENGVLCPWADWEIEFEGDVIATCSADLRDTCVATSRTRKAWHGRALGIRKVEPSRLYEDFLNPPPEVKVGCYYYWVNERVDPEGVRKDLGWMKANGITRAFLCTDIRNRYRADEPFGAADELIGKNEFWSDYWWENLRTALKVAGELDIEIGLFNCPGWSQSGGPWIKPEESMRDYNPTNGVGWEVCRDKWDGLRSNGPCSPKATGLEVDKLSAKHVRKHFDSFIGEILRRIPKEERPTLTTVVIDSWERGTQNYTDGIFEKFKARFGYDLDYSRGKCQKDLKTLLAELVANEYIGTMTKCAHENGLITWCEPYAHSLTIMDGVTYGMAADEVAAEFWAGEPKNERTKEVNNALWAARKSGKNKVYAESFTAGRWERHATDDWSFESLKPYADKFFHKGINATILHVVISQPGDESEPPVRPWFGTFFDRRSKNAADTKRLVDYCRRCNFMLQAGKPHEGKTDERILDDGTIIRFTPDSLFEVSFPDGHRELWNPEQPQEN